MYQNSLIKRREIYDNTHNNNSLLKYKNMNLAINKRIKIPSFNSLTKCSTHKKSPSFSLNIPIIQKNKYIPKITKFDTSNISNIITKSNNFSRNSHIIILKSLNNRTIEPKLDKKFLSLKIIPSSNKNSSFIDKNAIQKKTGKSLSPYKLINLNNYSPIKKKEKININSEMKKNTIIIDENIYNKKDNIGSFKSIFNNKRNKNVKTDIFNEIRKYNVLAGFKHQKLKIKSSSKKNIIKCKCKKDLLNIDINENKKNKKKFLEYIIKNNNCNKILKIDLLKKNKILPKEKKIKIKPFENPKNNKLYEFNNYNAYEILKDIFYGKNKIPILKKEKYILYINKIVYNPLNINFSLSTKGIINDYLAIRYNSKGLFFNYIESFKLNKSNSLNYDNSLIEMKLIHVNVEYELNFNQKIIEHNSHILNKPFQKKFNSYDFGKFNNYIKTKAVSRVTTDKFWEKFSLLKDANFFRNKNKKFYSKVNIQKISIDNNRRKSLFLKQIYLKLNKNNKIVFKKFLKKDDFEKLRNLIFYKNNNEFIYQCNSILDNYDINTCDKEGNTLLTFACMNGDIKIVKYLLDNGANPNCDNILSL